MFQSEASNPSLSSEVIADSELADRIREADLEFGLVGFDEDKLGLVDNRCHPQRSTSPVPDKAVAVTVTVTEAPAKAKRRSSVMRTMNVRRSSRFFRRQNSDSDQIIGSVFQEVSVEMKQKSAENPTSPSRSSSASDVGISSKRSLPKVLTSVENIESA